MMFGFTNVDIARLKSRSHSCHLCIFTHWNQTSKITNQSLCKQNNVESIFFPMMHRYLGIYLLCW